MATACEITYCPVLPAIIVRDRSGNAIAMCRGHWEDLVIAHTLIKDVVNVVDELAAGTARLALDVDSFQAGAGKSAVDVARAPGGGLPVCITRWDDLSWVRAGG